MAPQRGTGELKDEVEDGIRVCGGLVGPARHGVVLEYSGAVLRGIRPSKGGKRRSLSHVRAEAKAYGWNKLTIELIHRQASRCATYIQTTY